MATDLPTVAEQLAVVQQSLRTSIDPDGTGAIDLNPGSKLDIFESAALALSARNTAFVANRVANRSVQTATGEDLDVVAKDIYNTERKSASASTGTVYLIRPSGGTTLIPKGSRFSAPANGDQPAVTFQASVDIPVLSGVLKAAIPNECVIAGALGNVDLPSITSIDDALPDTGWAIFVPTFGDPVLNGGEVDVFAGGDDGEVGFDEVFRARLLKSSFDAATAVGTYPGIKAKALAVPGIRDVTLVAPGDGTMVIYAGDVNYLLSDALRARLVLALESSRAFGVPALVYRYTVINVQITGTIYMNRQAQNYDVTAIRAQAVANELTYFTTVRESPDSYFLSAISAAMENAHDEVQSVVLTSPSADQKPLAPSSYAGLSTINRYVTSAAYIQIAIQDPQTL